MGQIFYKETPSFKSDIWIDWENRGMLITSIDDTGASHYLEFSVFKKNGQLEVHQGNFSISIDELKQILEYYEKHKSSF